MAQFSMELPDEIAKQLETLYQNTDKMCKEMTKSGAKVVKKNIDKAGQKCYHVYRYRNTDSVRFQEGPVSHERQPS